MPRSLNIPGRVGIVTVNVDRNVAAVLLYGVNGEVGQDIRRRAYAVQKRMKRLAPVKTGDLRDSIKVESVRESSKGPVSKVYSDMPHAIVAEVGRRPVKASGTYKSKKNLPSRATGSAIASGKLQWGRDNPSSPKWLRFENKSGDIVFWRNVAAAKGAHYMERSIDAALN